MRRTLSALVLVAVLTLSLAVVPFAGLADNHTERADLTIEQPDYVDSSVDVERTSNATVYNVRGPEHTITFDSANASNVTSVGVLDGPGAITPDSSGTFTFSAEGKEATTTIYFDVDDGESTTRYTASIRTSDVGWVHRPVEDDEAIQEKASLWDDISREAQKIVPGQDPMETLTNGLGYVGFFKDPTSSLFSDMQGTLVMLFFTPGGLLIAGSMFAITVVMLARAYRYKNRTQKQFAELEEMQREKDKAWLQKARKILQQCEYNDLWPDHTARALRDYFGNNIWLAFKEYSLMRSPTSVKATTLQMMAQTGYVGRVAYDEAGNLVDARAVRDSGDDYEDIPVTDGGNIEEIDLATLSYENDHDRQVISMIPSADLDERVFDADIDTSEVSFPIDNREVSDAQLLDELNPEFPGDFEDREQMARVLSDLMQFVANHDHTDDEGTVRRERDLLSFMMDMDTILHDEADFPAAYLYQKELLYVAEHMDKGDQLQDRIDAAELDGVSGGHSFGVDAAGGD